MKLKEKKYNKKIFKVYAVKFVINKRFCHMTTLSQFIFAVDSLQTFFSFFSSYLLNLVLVRLPTKVKNLYEIVGTLSNMCFKRFWQKNTKIIK